MPQQHSGMTYAGAAGFNTTAAFQQFQPAPQQQPMIRQFQPATTHHHYPQQQPPQIMQMNPTPGGMAIMDTQMLQGATPPTLPYMAHHQQIQQPTSTQPMQAVKAPSKAIKIVNPETMKEVDTKNLNVSKQTLSPASSARSTPKPESEQVQQQFKQNVHGIASTTNDDVTATQPVPIATVTPLVSGSDVTTTVVADSSTNLASTTSTDEKPKPTITPPVSKSSDDSKPLTSESEDKKEFISEVPATTDTVCSAKEESETISEELTVVSNTLKSSEVQVEQPELPPEANEEFLLPEQQKVEVSSSGSSISHEDIKAEETEDINKPNTNMEMKMADDLLSEQRSIVYKPDDVEVTALEQQAAVENTKDVVDEDGSVLVALPQLPSVEDKQLVSEEVPVTLEPVGDEPEESSRDLPPIEEIPAKDDDGMC